MRTSTSSATSPRVATTSSGVFRRLHPAVEDDARVDRPVVRLEEARDRVAARLLLAVADDAEGHGQRALGRERLDRLQLHPELALVVGDAARVEPLAAHLGGERVALPELERVRRLHVVVPVDEDGRRAGRPRDLADDEPSVLAHLGLAAERAHLLGDPVGGARDVAPRAPGRRSRSGSRGSSPSSSSQPSGSAVVTARSYAATRRLW